MHTLYRNLNLIFWGMLIIIIDLSLSKTVNGFGFKMDLVNDLIGAIIIYFAVTRISKTQIIAPSYKLNINLAVIASVIQIFVSFSDFFIYEESYFTLIIETIVIFIVNVGIILFCNSMVIFSREKLLKESLRHWIITRKLFFWIYLIFFGIINLTYTINSLLLEKKFEWQIDYYFSEGISMIIIFTVLLLPIIYSLITIRKMRKEIRFNLQ